MMDGEPRDPEGVERRVLRQLIRFDGRDVVEIGSGDGRLTWRYADRAASVLGIDPDETLVARALATQPPALRERVAFRVANAASVELPEAGFDLALLAWSI